MDVLGGDYDERGGKRTEKLPYIWFPWYGTFDREKMKKEVIAEFREFNENPLQPIPRWGFDKISENDYQKYLQEYAYDKENKLPKYWIRQEMKERTPDVIVIHGDRIAVDRLERVWTNDDVFAPLHDRSEFYLFVKVIDRRGITKVLDKPIVMYGSTELSYWHSSFPLYAILERVRKYFELERITMDADRALSKNFGINANAYAALGRAAQLCDWYLPHVHKFEFGEKL